VPDVRSPGAVGPTGDRSVARPERPCRSAGPAAGLGLSGVTPGELARLTHARDAALLVWDPTSRPWPWRDRRDAWAVLVSEVMLVQTSAIRVAERFPLLIERFPDTRAMAEVPLSVVLEAWGGLGYPRRARFLWEAARRIEAEGGRVPLDPVALERLPGVGPYISRAVAALAGGVPVGAVDVNAARVLSRWVGRPLNRRQLQAVADLLVADVDPWRWTQCLFDLGATVCSGRPACTECSCLKYCHFRGEGVDPSRSSFGRSRPQARFEGSDRQARGRLLAAARGGGFPREAAGRLAGWPEDEARVTRVLESLVADGLLAVADGQVILSPGEIG
jgi:A/G-specific adenine glycosylase